MTVALRGHSPPVSTLVEPLAVKLYDENQHTVAQICQMLGVSKPTLYKYLAAGKEPGQGKIASTSS